MTRVLRLVGVLCVAGVLFAQAPASRPTDAAPVAAARELLSKLGRAGQDLTTLRARCVQERTTALRRTSLVSRGEVRYRSEPPCVLFAFDEPRPVQLRLDTGGYEVLRPQDRTLERFVLDRDDLPRALFQAFRPDLQQLEERFAVQGSTPVTGPDGKTVLHEIKLAPRHEETLAWLRELTLTVDPGANAVVAIAYRDGQGDLVAIRLEGIERNPRLAADAFTLAAPAGTQVLTHPARAPASQPASREAGR